MRQYHWNSSQIMYFTCRICSGHQIRHFILYDSKDQKCQIVFKYLSVILIFFTKSLNLIQILVCIWIHPEYTYIADPSKIMIWPHRTWLHFQDPILNLLFWKTTLILSIQDRLKFEIKFYKNRYPNLTKKIQLALWIILRLQIINRYEKRLI